jgi:hypothetical protein
LVSLQDVTAGGGGSLVAVFLPQRIDDLVMLANRLLQRTIHVRAVAECPPKEIQLGEKDR